MSEIRGEGVRTSFLPSGILGATVGFGSASSPIKDGFLPANRSTPPNMDTPPTGFFGLGLSEITSFFSSTFGFSSTDFPPNKSSSSSLNKPVLVGAAVVCLGFVLLIMLLSVESGAACDRAADKGDTDSNDFCGDWKKKWLWSKDSLQSSTITSFRQ